MSATNFVMRTRWRKLLCRTCGNQFDSSRHDALDCSARCRKYFNRTGHAYPDLGNRAPVGSVSGPLNADKPERTDQPSLPFAIEVPPAWEPEALEAGQSVTETKGPTATSPSVTVTPSKKRKKPETKKSHKVTGKTRPSEKKKTTEVKKGKSQKGKSQKGKSRGK